MYTDESPENSFEFKTWTPDITSKEVRTRKIERVRLSVQLSLFSLERVQSHQTAHTQPEVAQSEEELKVEARKFLVAHKKTSSADVSTRKKKYEQTKSLAKRNMLEAIQAEAQCVSIADKTTNDQTVHNHDSLKSLNNSENSKSLIEQENPQNYLNVSISSESNSDDDSEGSQPDEDFTLSPPKIGEHRHSIFFTRARDEAQELREELQIEDSQDIFFIQGDFFSYYQECEILGEGASGTVKKCIKNGTDQVFAVKIVRYRGDTERLFSDVKEFENHKRLSHKNIIKVHELYIDYFNKKTYLVMELVEGREMLSVIQEVGCFSEPLASKILKQIISGTNYLHLNGVCHRDLKPDNILVSQDGEIVKIIDFNVSKFSKSQDYTAVSNENYKMWTQTGTIAFTAPEVFNDSQYTEAIDMWSVGVIMYTMLCGYQPFKADNVHDLIEQIKKAEYEFHSPAWDHISPQATDLIRCLLNVDVKKRYSPFQALIHPWIENQGNSANTHIIGTMDNLWTYFNGGRQQPDSVQDDGDDYEDGNYYDRNYKNMQFSNVLLLSKITASSTHIQAQCLDKSPLDTEECKPKALLPKISHFSTQGELPQVFSQPRRDLECHYTNGKTGLKKL